MSRTYAPRTAGIVIMSVLAVMITAATAAHADSARIDGLLQPNIRVLGVEGETVSYFAGRNRRISLDKFELVSLKNHPELKQAWDAMNAGQAEKAAGLFATVRRSVREDDLKPLLTVYRIRALDEAGEFDKALDEYLSLIRSNQEDYYVDKYPTRFPEEESDRKQASKKVEAVLKLARKPKLQAALTELKSGLVTVDATLEPGEASVAGTGTTGYRGPLGDRQVERLVERKKYADALRAAVATLESNRRPTASLYFNKAKAESALNKPRDAALSYMRVVIHFERHPLVIDALEETGKIMRDEFNDEAAARRLWTEARDRAPRQSDKDRIDKLLNSL